MLLVGVFVIDVGDCLFMFIVGYGCCFGCISYVDIGIVVVELFFDWVFYWGEI